MLLLFGRGLISFFFSRELLNGFAGIENRQVDGELKRNWMLSSTNTPLPRIATEEFFFNLFHIGWPCKHYNFQRCLCDNLVPRMQEIAFSG